MSAVAEAVKELAPMFAGRLLQPGEAGYDDARRVHNGLVDKHPALIAQCRGTADIADAIRLARKLKLAIAVRGGGHNVAGRATCDHGVMIDLSLMRSVSVDPKAKTARVEGGATWRDFNRETQSFGLATTGGVVGSTGVAGLTLGGGLGWLMGKYGMALDNVLAVTLVTADGQVMRVSHDEHPDLFWALRGGGGNFGVAASFEFRLHAVGPIVIGGLVAHPLPKAKEVLHFFRDQMNALPDDMMLVAAMLTAPDGSGHKIVGLAGGHFGSMADAERAAKPIKAFGPPVMDVFGPIPYAALNGIMDDGFPRGAFNYWKSSFLPKLTDAALDVLIAQAGKLPTDMCKVVLEVFHGAATRVPVDATAYALRSAGINLAIIGQWMDPGDAARCTAWVKETAAAIQPFAGPIHYLNYVNPDDGGDSAAASYGPNLPRLREIKRRYDPENVFHLNVNIKP